MRPTANRNRLTYRVAGLILGVLLSGVIDIGASGPQQTSSHRVFGTDAGLVLNFIKPEKTADFEVIIAKLKEALQKSDKPERRRQAAGWKVFRAVEPGANGSVLYLFVLDPAVKGADYTVSTILAEAYPTEVQALYKQYAESYAAGQNVVSLAVVTRLGELGAP